jgi:hypothetical protein
MNTLPERMIPLLRPFETVFSTHVWAWARVLLIGAILTPGERTVAAILRVMGRSHDKQFQNNRRVLNRATWSSRRLSKILLLLLVSLFVPANAPVVKGINATIERRRGSKIAARGIYRDAVRSRKEFFVKTNGLRWISLMVLTPIPWAGHVWALPFLTVLAPSERYHDQHQKAHKTITDWARQVMRQIHRWLPERTWVIVADGSDAVVEFLAHLVRLSHITLVTHMRLDAALYDPAPCGKRLSEVGLQSKATVKWRSSNAWPILLPYGNSAPLPAMGASPARERSPPARPCGIIRNNSARTRYGLRR